MKIDNEKLTILKFIENEGKTSSGNISKAINLPHEDVLTHLRYLKRMNQIEDGKGTFKEMLDIELTREGQETIESNKNLWTKISSKISGFSIGGIEINLK